MTETLAPDALLRLATWLSPAFPIGAFACSHGLEAAVAERAVRGGADVRDWIATLLDAGSGWNDLVLFAAAYRAAYDEAALREVADLAGALAGSRERLDETVSLGTAFTQAVAPWAPDGEPTPYPVAVALAAHRDAIPLAPALVAYANAFAANLVAAATRLVPLGQREAMRVLRDLESAILGAASRAADSTPDDLGSAAILSDIAAMRHETLTTRLFRT